MISERGIRSLAVGYVRGVKPGVNVVLHRTYGMGAVPIRFYAYSNRIEVDNPGGVHHGLRMKDFGRSTAYRNHLLAEARKSFVHKLEKAFPRW